MPNWNEVIIEIQQEKNRNPAVNPLDTVKRKYLKKVSEISGTETTFTDVIGTDETYYYSLKPNYKEEGAFYVSDIIEVKGSDDTNKIK